MTLPSQEFGPGPSDPPTRSKGHFKPEGTRPAHYARPVPALGGAARPGRASVPAGPPGSGRERVGDAGVGLELGDLGCALDVVGADVQAEIGDGGGGAGEGDGVAAVAVNR